MKQLFKLLTLAAVVLAASCSGGADFTQQEIELINANPDGLMHIYKADNEQELQVLKSPSQMLSKKAINSDDYKKLEERMKSILADSDHNGIGLSAPQLGINKAVVAIRRQDLDGQPVIVYPNITIDEYSEDIYVADEGCLSVPGKSGNVDRSMVVVVKYFNTQEQKMVKDTIKSYASIVFQHEIDHLYGILYTDRAW